MRPDAPTRSFTGVADQGCRACRSSDLGPLTNRRAARADVLRWLLMPETRTFDTHAAVKVLTNAGAEPELAEAFVAVARDAGTHDDTVTVGSARRCPCKPTG